MLKSLGDKKTILLLGLPYYDSIFGKSTVKQAIPRGMVTLGLAAIAPLAIKKGLKVKFLDLNIADDPQKTLLAAVKELKPDFVGITFTTPLFVTARNYSSIIRKWRRDAVIVGGGPHASVLPEEVMRETDFDVVVRGEGDVAFSEIVTGKDLREIPGISYKQDGEIVSNPPRVPIPDLDSLPFPALDLYELERYHYPSVISKRNPVAPMETSRGCIARCSFCSKSVFQMRYRAKSPDRVLDEMEYLLSLGYREIHLVDDMFTADLNRAKTICEKIINSDMDIVWYPRAGIRVDVVDEELFVLMKRSGVWRIPFGIESGNQEVLNRTNKKITLEQVRRCVSLAKKAGIEVEGYFMLGLPGETKETIEDTVRFSLSLDLDLVKYSITVPLPGTPLFEEWERAGAIKTKDWSKYSVATPVQELYNHPTLSWETINEYYTSAPRRFYFRPSFIIKRFFKSLKSGDLLSDTMVALRTRWW